MILLCLLFFSAYAQDYLSWVQKIKSSPTGERHYRSLGEMYHNIAQKVRDKPGVITPIQIGQTTQKRPIWGFVLQEPAREIRVKILIFAGLHPLEWVSNEVAMEVIEVLYRHPIPYVAVTVIPAVNVDRRLLAEKELRLKQKKYRRSNAKGVDLNRDFSIHRESDAIWKHIIPDYYQTSPAPLSQPETRALDALADKERFHSIVSLHCFGGYIYYPWAGRYAQILDVKEHHRLASIMVRAQRDPFPYKAMQLSHWGFPFRALGAEIDHFYAKYKSYSFLIELTRSGLWPPLSKNISHPFRWYNPKKPQKDIRRGVDSILALAHTLGMEHWILDNSQ